MSGKLTIKINKDLMLTKERLLIEKTKEAKNIKQIGYGICIPVVLLLIVAFCLGVIPEEHKSTWLYAIVSFVILSWYSVCGYRIFYILDHKMKLKQESFPIEQSVEFDDIMLKVSTEKSMKKVLWDDIEMACENDQYWFFGREGIVIDKNQVSEEQFHFFCRQYQKHMGEKSFINKKVVIILATLVLVMGGVLLATLSKGEHLDTRESVNDANVVHNEVEKVLVEASTDTVTQEKLDTTRNEREILLKVSIGEEYEIKSDFAIKNFILSSVSSNDKNGFVYFFPDDSIEEGYQFRVILLDEKEKSIATSIRLNGTFYQLFWCKDDPSISNAEVLYYSDDNSFESITYGVNEAVCYYLDKKDYKIENYYYDMSGNKFDSSGRRINDENAPYQEEIVNTRIMVDGAMYECTGEISSNSYEEPYSGKITSTVSTWEVPTQHGESNFGVPNHPYVIVNEDRIDVFMDYNWVQFEKIWGISLSAKNITEEGMRLEYNYLTEPDAETFSVSDSYILEEKIDGEWKEIPSKTTNPYNEQNFSELLYPNTTLVEDINWKDIYGNLSTGTYRIGKSMARFVNDEFVTTVIYTEFTL